MEMKKTRLVYIDIAKGIGILLVLLGHLLNNGHWLKSVIYTFHMPLFFIVSGMVLRPQPVIKKIRNRITDVLVPYFIWALIFSGFSFKKLMYIGYGTIAGLLKAGSSGVLWFLVCMFFASIFSQIIVTYTEKKKHRSFVLAAFMVITLVISMAMSFFHYKIMIHGATLGYPWSMDIVFLAMSFMIFGRLAVDMKQMIPEELKWYHLLIFVALAAISLVGIMHKAEPGYPQMATGRVGNYIVFFVVACAVVTGVIGISRFLEKTGPLSALLVWLGQNSMGIFLIHRTLRSTLQGYYNAYPSIWLFIILFVVFVVYSSIVTIIINKLCPYLFGKSPKSRA